ncbi:MAG: COG1361 S-layer family protein, partial [Candidatus Bathyarchaeia archaeon]
EAGEAVTYHPKIYVDENTPLAVYILNLQVKYLDLLISEVRMANIQVGIVVDRVEKSYTRLNVEVKTTSLKVGCENNVTLSFENMGEKTIYKIDAILASTSPNLAIIKGNRFIYEELEPSDNVSHQITIAVSKNAPLGAYTITSSVSFEDEDGRTKTYTYTLGLNIDSVKVSRQTTVLLKEYSTDPIFVQPGKPVDVELKLQCIGDQAYDVRVQVSTDLSPQISPLTPLYFSLGDISINQKVSLVFRVLVDGKTNSGSYPIRLTITYLDSYGIQKTSTETITIRVRSFIELKIINLEDFTLEKGVVKTVEADLLLIGTESLKFVNIECLDSDVIKTPYRKETYIGALDPDSPTSFSLEISARPNATIGDYKLRLNVTYFDSQNQERSSLIEIPFKVVEYTQPSKPQQEGVERFWIWLRRFLGLI